MTAEAVKLKCPAAPAYRGKRGRPLPGLPSIMSRVEINIIYCLIDLFWCHMMSTIVYVGPTEIL